MLHLLGALLELTNFLPTFGKSLEGGGLIVAACE
jgi:hypothetical protein